MSNAPIGIFDSGFGGLTVMKEIKERLPFENLIYFGDTARIPYGNKGKETIIRYSVESANFLKSQGIKALVIACHTVSAVAFSTLQEMLDIPVIGIVQAGASAAIEMTKNFKIAVLGTKATIQSGVYNQVFAIHPQVEIFPIACPLFVNLIEEGFTRHTLAEIAAEEYLHSLKFKTIDTVLLACTHFPLLKEIIQKQVGEQVKLADPAQKCARELECLLQEKDLKNSGPEKAYNQFIVSDDPEKFRLLGELFLQYPVEKVMHLQDFMFLNEKA